VATGNKSGKKVYRAPRTGERRKHRKPLRIDRLPAQVKSTIIEARAAGETWKNTAAMASAASGLRLSPSVVQRWHDLRVEQPRNTGDIAPLLREILDLLKSRLPAVQS
jgi:hypothetical protein